MTRRHWRESIKSLFGNHIDPEHDERLKGTKSALSKQEAEEIIKKLKFEIERLDVEKGKLLVENGELKQNLDASGNVEAELNERLQEMSKEKDNLIVEKEIHMKEKLSEKDRELSSLASVHKAHRNVLSAQIKELEARVTGLELELESFRAHNRDMGVQIESKVSEIKGLGEENLLLKAQNSELEIMSKERGDELLALRKKLDDDEKESLSKVESLTAQVNTLLADLECLNTQKAELEEQMVSKGDEASSQVKGLMDQVNELQQQMESLHNEKLNWK
ncbi:hypothetical protein GH714_005533 [Hevea brasiliensis]|uniref:Uncharacterized protein n=1 Tax=Hevea brasiliensis TaxID=3981 RepID=A0A6A6LBJ0_HEVBR|nr:hypothetical protein GH714_005533 [Hevea brasiliensis]